MDTKSVAEEKTNRMRRILKEAEERFQNEMLDVEERLEVLDRVKRLRRALEAAGETVDAQHAGLERL